MKSYKFNRLPGNGCLYLPLSMTRLCNSQSPEKIYQATKNIMIRAKELSIDVIFIYCNSLYLNNSINIKNTRYKFNAQMLTHKMELEKIILKDKFLSMKFIHFIPWDYLILLASPFYEILSNLQKLANTDPLFFELIKHESNTNYPNENQISFILEETIITYLIRQRFIKIPGSSSNNIGWNLICYPGHCLTTDVYIHNHQILPINQKIYHENYFSEMVAESMLNLDSDEIEYYPDLNLEGLRFSTLPTVNSILA